MDAYALHATDISRAADLVDFDSSKNSMRQSMAAPAAAAGTPRVLLGAPSVVCCGECGAECTRGGGKPKSAATSSRTYKADQPFETDLRVVDRGELR